MFEDRILTDISGNRPSVLAMNVARSLFTGQEIESHRLSPSKRSTKARPPFPQEKALAIKALKSNI